jgi:NADP-dependent alcohol dehydrogenase
MYRKMIEGKVDKLAQFGERVWNINEGSKKEKALKAIQLTEEFFQKLGVSTRISDYADGKEETKQRIMDRFIERGWKGLGENADVNPELVGEIVEMSW